MTSKWVNAAIFGPHALLNNRGKPKVTGLEIQSSALDQGIPVGWGKFRVPWMLGWTNNFKKSGGGILGTALSGGKGGGVGGKGASGGTYSAAIIGLLCEGPIQSVNNCFENGQITSLSELNLTAYLGTDSQTPPSFIVTKYPDQAESYARTAYLFSPKFKLGSSPQLPINSFEVTGTFSGTMPGTPDANFGDIIEDLLTNVQYGVGFDAANIDTDSLDLYITYCRAQGLFASPLLMDQETGMDVLNRWGTLSNTWIFTSGSVIKFVPLGDSEITANGVTYTPIQPVRYNFTMADFLDPDEPLKVTRKDPADCYNRVAIEIEDRNTADANNAYNSFPCEWKDSTLINEYGIRDASSTGAHEIKDRDVGQTIVTLMGQRIAYIRNGYAWRAPYRFVLLEPGDIVTVTDPNNSAITNLQVRITRTEQADDDSINFEAEEFPGVVGTVSTGMVQGVEPSTINKLDDPGDVNTPAVFEPDSALTNGVPQIWIAVSGGPAWGGCQVYVSFDDVSYTLAGLITAPAKQGVLTDALPSHADPDTVNTFGVDLEESEGILNPVTNADADAFRTLALISPQPTGNVLAVTGAELIAYGDVATTGEFTADLSYLRRGAYGTTIASHASGQQFTLVDLVAGAGTTAIYNLPQDYIGGTIYLKFVSYNQFGAAPQDISAVTAYEFTPSGLGFGGGAGGVPVEPGGLAVTATKGGYISASWNANPATDKVTGYTLWMAAGPGGMFGSAAAIWTGLATDIKLSNIAAGDQTFFLTAQNVVGQSDETAGVDETVPLIADGEIPIGNGSGVTWGTITAGANTTVVNTPGGIEISSTGGGGGGGGIPSVAITKPAAASWTSWVNQNGSAVADGVSGMLITWEPLAAANYTGLFDGLGANTVFTCRLLSTLAFTNYNANGIALRESATGKMLGVRYGWATGLSCEAETYSSPTARTGVASISGMNLNYPPPWWRWRISGGTVYFDVSYSGESTDWVNLYSIAVATAFTTAPDEVGFYGSSIGTPTSQVIQSALAS